MKGLVTLRAEPTHGQGSTQTVSVWDGPSLASMLLVLDRVERELVRDGAAEAVLGDLRRLRWFLADAMEHTE